MAGAWCCGVCVRTGWLVSVNLLVSVNFDLVR